MLINLNKRLDRADRAGIYARPKKSFKKALARFVFFLLILLVFIYLPLRGAYSSAKDLSANSKVFSQAFKDQNLEVMKTSLKQMKNDSDGLNHSLIPLSWIQIIPLVGGYIGDARHLAAALDDELSAAGIILERLDKSDIAGSDKVAQMVNILSKSLSNLDRVEPALKEANDEVSSIDVNKYPENLKGKNLKLELTTAKNLIQGTYLAVSKNRNALKVAPSALGSSGNKTYLILFQNDKELRATGGFMTAFAFIKLDNGHVSTTTSDDIYRLDEQLLKVCQDKICPLTPPDPIVKYLPEANGKTRTAWSIRDSNLSPDLPTSMKQFESMYSLLDQGLPFDGIITIDTEVVRQMIEITGPVDVYGTKYSADVDKRCSCPNVIYELENYSEIVAKGQTDRKAILGTLMQQILQKALSSSTEKMPEFLTAMGTLAGSKHMMFYMHDGQVQNALSELNWTGRIKQTSGDFLHINDSNFAGAKSNLYVTEDVTLDIDTNSGKHKLVINYSNPHSYTTWLNAINRDYVRVYVPEGSKLILSRGSEVAVTTIEHELGKTAFEAFIQTRPQNSRVLEFDYTTPTSNYGDPYPILIQKQPGTKNFKYTIKINGQTKKTFELSSDQDLKF